MGPQCVSLTQLGRHQPRFCDEAKPRRTVICVVDPQIQSQRRSEAHSDGWPRI